MDISEPDLIFFQPSYRVSHIDWLIEIFKLDLKYLYISEVLEIEFHQPASDRKGTTNQWKFWFYMIHSTKKWQLLVRYRPTNICTYKQFGSDEAAAKLYRRPVDAKDGSSWSKHPHANGDYGSNGHFPPWTRNQQEDIELIWQ